MKSERGRKEEREMMEKEAVRESCMDDYSISLALLILLLLLLLLLVHCHHAPLTVFLVLHLDHWAIQ